MGCILTGKVKSEGSLVAIKGSSRDDLKLLAAYTYEPNKGEKGRIIRKEREGQGRSTDTSSSRGRNIQPFSPDLPQYAVHSENQSRGNGEMSSKG